MSTRLAFASRKKRTIMFKRLSQNFLLFFATVAVLVVAGEAAVRLFSDLSVPLIKRDLRLGMIFRENTTRDITGPESGKMVRIRTNGEGFRTPARPAVKPPGTVRIALLGDSQIAAINTREEETTAVLLEKKLNHNHPQFRWEVFNFGISGANTAQELNLYREVVRKYGVDMVICAYYNGNDFSDNSVRLSRNPRIQMDFRRGSDELVTIYPSRPRKNLSNWLNENSRLYVWQKHFIGDALNNFIAAGGAGKDQKVRDEFLIFVNDPADSTLEYSWRINERIIEEFDREVRADEAVFLFLSIPHGIETMQRQWEEFQRMAAGTRYEESIDRGLPERKLREIMEKHGIDHLFLRETFANHMEQSEPEAPGYHVAYRKGFGHLNETGNLLMTEALLAYLDKSGVITRLIER